MNNKIDLLFWAVTMTAFYGLVQLGELLPNNQSDSNKVPILQALTFGKADNNTFATIQLARTKPHKSAIRASLIIHLSNDTLCSICALKAYAHIRTQSTYANNNNMLFIKENNSWATKRWFIAKLKQLLPTENVAGHSFRAGGTTELVMRGVQLILIQKIGRWDSDSFYRYIHSHPATIASILTKAYSD